VFLRVVEEMGVSLRAKAAAEFSQALRMEGAWRYILPFSLYLLAPLLALHPIFQPQLKVYYGYALRILLAGSALLLSLHRYPELRGGFHSLDTLAILTGAGIFALWVSLEGAYPLLGSTSSHYNPSSLADTSLEKMLLLLRLIGSVVIAPVIEELFMRSYLLRLFISSDWEKVELGSYSAGSFLAVTLLFGLAHHRWLPALLAGALLNLLIYQRRSIAPCITAHATANLLLLAYASLTGDWTFY